MTIERWRPIPSSPGYEASSLGRVRSVDRVLQRSSGPVRLRGRVLATWEHPKGYLTIRLGGDNGTRTVHSLVAEAWLGPRPDGAEVCHGPGGQQDNRPGNLRYDDKSGNMRDAVRDGTHANASKATCLLDHVLVEPNLMPGRLPSRICLACSRARARVNRLRRSGVDVTPHLRREIADGYHREIMARAS